ncbi:hypothetical protein K435DRAFT_768185 [Dendrothele bispora CBS 962.96]|uniref:Protein-S-isoprenylcysteine O-methyltransferase n=1 Tax=Dendrothele bispora (strain CBS 962.96) TaxID=1314807 RepID=A0A4S8KW95_DENBC|nr:hypothetical protein K435DRAFT_768185 [Dendrothele bispora CBS 962.96]
MRRDIDLLLKLPLLASDAICMRIIATPPNVPLPPKDVVIPDWREKFLRGLALPCVILRALSWSAELFEFLVILASMNPTGPVSQTLLRLLISHGNETCVASLRITPPFLLGNLITISGTILRISCYRTLGRYFTFELRVQKPHHKLITNGPYAFVRHPSYTAMILSIVGVILCHAQRGSWIVQCSGLPQTLIGKVLIGYWVLTAVAVVLSLFLRIDREDSMLKDNFGKSWDQWRDKVRWRLIPGIY